MKKLVATDEYVAEIRPRLNVVPFACFACLLQQQEPELVLVIARDPRVDHFVCQVQPIAVFNLSLIHI